jgi:flagellar basal body-associated protein FliL
MANEEETKTVEKEDAKKTSGKTELLIYAVVIVGVLIAGSAGGLIAGKIFGPAKAGAGTTDEQGERVVEMGEQPKALSPAEQHAEKDAANLTYYDLNRLTVTLNEPGMARYVAVTVTLAMSKADESAATKAIEAAKPTLINQLTVYLAGCSLEDVRGPKNMNRMRREMLDIINSVVWPDQRPLVVDVLFKEFAVS